MGAPDSEDNDPLIGTSFADRYMLTSRLGKGGMAVVYKAVDKNLGREVALKVLRKDVAGDPIAAKRLIREARAAASLHHPHIITIHDVGEKDGTVYVVMEILVGRALSDVMEEAGALGVERSLIIAEQMASALVVAHTQNIIHRDIKPENLYLLEAGGGDFVKLLDFSIAKLPTEMVTAALTRAGSVFGTPHYMAPEQVEGKGVCQQTDLYALGAVLYEMITGEPPFDGPSIIDILLKHVKSPPPSLANRGLKLPTGLSEFIQQLLAKKAPDRPQSASAVRDEIGKMLNELRHSQQENAAPGPLDELTKPLGDAVLPKNIAPPIELTLPVAVSLRQDSNTMRDDGPPASQSAVHASIAPADVVPEAATMAVDTAAVTAGVVAARAKAISSGMSPVAAMKAETKMDLITEVSALDDVTSPDNLKLPSGAGTPPRFPEDSKPIDKGKVADVPRAPVAVRPPSDPRPAAVAAQQAPPPEKPDLPANLELPDLPASPAEKRKFSGFGESDHPEQRTIVGVGLGRMVAELAKQRAVSGAHRVSNSAMPAQSGGRLADAPTAAAPVMPTASAQPSQAAAVAAPSHRPRPESGAVAAGTLHPHAPPSQTGTAAAMARPAASPNAAQGPAARPPPPPQATAGHTRRPPPRVAAASSEDRVPTQPGLGVDPVAPVTVHDAQGVAAAGPVTVQLQETKVVHVSKVSAVLPVASPKMAGSTKLMLVALGLFAVCAVAAAAWVLLKN